ncbi:hypothetical protein ACPB9J_33405 [Streptomyces lavendulocolor]|uniref:hypothetical protein n=1 Tax=Streptomyces lavendulocolor TaxID=67316 RepID=UPI003C2C2AF3
MPDDLLLALAVPLLIASSYLYALTESWWRRRHPAGPVPYLPGRAPRAQVCEQVAAAEAVVADAYARYGDLYDTPLPDTGRLTAGGSP